MQPSDSLDSFSRGFDSSRQRPTSWGRRLFCRLRRRLTHVPAYALDPEIDHRLSVQPQPPEERQGPPGLLGRPLCACRGATPRRTRFLLAPTSLREDQRRSRHRLHGKQNARHPEWNSFRGHINHGPQARVPTLRRSRCRDRRQARYRLGRAHPWPGGICTRWTTCEISRRHRIPSYPNRPAEPGRTVFSILITPICICIARPNDVRLFSS
jgi:hypothetical protein